MNNTNSNNNKNNELPHVRCFLVDTPEGTKRCTIDINGNVRIRNTW